MPRNNYFYNRELVPRAREFRREMTRHEKHLWYDFLKGYPKKVYRQRIISGYIADFYCASAKLVIELDGSQHFEKEVMAYDAGRTCVLENLGIKVIRFTNDQVDKEYDAVCSELDRVITDRLSNV